MKPGIPLVAVGIAKQLEARELRPTRRRPVLWIAALVCMVAGLSFAAPARAQSLNMGAGLRWHGWVQTDVKFSEFFGSNFTVMARFMPQYTRSYRGPILGVGRTCVVLPCKPGPRFALGQSDFKKAGDVPRLVLEIGNVTRTYLAPGLVPGTWQHIALRREKARAGAVFRVFLNGTQLCADPGAYSTCNLTLAAPALPVGTLRLGRTWSSNGGIAATRQQFYGLLDDVAVFDSALPPGQIAALANATLHPRLLGWEPGLYAGWTFDAQTPTGDPLPASLARPITYEGGAYLWPFLSQTRDSEFDDDYLPVAREDLVMDLPFPQGQAWKVTQGYSSTASHYGASAFSRSPTAGRRSASPSTRRPRARSSLRTTRGAISRSSARRARAPRTATSSRSCRRPASSSPTDISTRARSTPPWAPTRWERP
jgi:hypothetical protein